MTIYIDKPLTHMCVNSFIILSDNLIEKLITAKLWYFQRRIELRKKKHSTVFIKEVTSNLIFSNGPGFPKYCYQLLCFDNLLSIFDVVNC